LPRAKGKNISAEFQMDAKFSRNGGYFFNEWPQALAKRGSDGAALNVNLRPKVPRLRSNRRASRPRMTSEPEFHLAEIC